MIDVKDLSFKYGRRQILDDISFSVPNNSLTGILGKNGAGKTTLLKCLCNILSVSKGEIFLDKTSIQDIKISDIPKYIGYVSQYSTSESITVFDYVLLGRVPYIGFKSSQSDLKLVEEILHYMNIEEFAFSLTTELSGGEFQKVKIARALVGEPKILLLDEPTNNLDLKSQVQIMNLIRHVADKHGLTVLMTVHDINLAFRYCDHLMLLRDNSIYAYEEKDQVTIDMLQDVYDVSLSSSECMDSKVFVPF